MLKILLICSSDTNCFQSPQLPKIALNTFYSFKVEFYAFLNYAPLSQCFKCSFLNIGLLLLPLNRDLF